MRLMSEVMDDLGLCVKQTDQEGAGNSVEIVEM